MNKISRIAVGGYVSVVAFVATMGIAGATPPPIDPSADTVTFLGNQVDVLYPMLLALAAAPVALYLLRWGIRKVLGFIRSGGRSTVV